MSSADRAAPVEPESAGDVLDTARAGPLALRGSALRVGGYGGGMLLALISAPLLIRHLHQGGYGRYITAVSVATITASLTEGGVNAIAMREFASRRGPDRDAAMANMLSIRLLLSVLAMAAAVGFAAAVGYAQVIVVGTAVASVGVNLQVVQEVVAVPLQGTMRLGWVAAADLLRNAVNTFLIVVLVIAGAGLVPLLAVSAPAGVASLCLIVFLVRKTAPLRLSGSFSAYVPLLREAIPFALAVALSSIYFRVTVIVMSLEASAVETGYFSTSFRVVEILISLPTLVIGAAYPIVTRAARDDPERFAYATRRMFELSVLLGVWLAVSMFELAPFAVRLLGGPAAAPAAAVLRIQGLAVAGTFVAVACGFPLLSIRRYRALLVANGLGLVVTLAVSLSLVPVLAARGAAIATVAAELALAAASVTALISARRDLRLPLGVFPIALVAGGVSLGIGAAAGVHPILQACIATAVYALVLVAFRRFPPEIGHAIRG
jgi:O-antigen/teichoic acid export membrane protein